MINERKLSKSELEKREDIIMKMKGNKRDLVKKYGKDAEAVMYGRATNMAKKKTENMRDSKLTELIKDALKNPKKADLDKDGKLSSYEKTRGKAIEKSMANEDLESGQYGDPKVGNYDITSQNDNEAGDIEALSAAGLEEGTDNEMELKGQEMVDYIMKTWDWSEEKTLKFLADKFGNLKEDIDIGHEDNEPGMLQGDLYQVGKSAMEIYALLDDMEGEGEVDLPSWWQAKIFKAKEAIVGAAEYLNFELKEPAIDAVVDTVEPLEIEVDPLGETVEDYITSVDDLTEVEIPSSVLSKINAEINSPKAAASVILSLVNVVLDKESQDYSKNPKMSRALDYLRDLADDKEIEEGLPKGFFDKAMDAKDEVDEVAGYDRKGNKEVEVEPSRFKGRDKSRLREEDLDESYKTLVNKLKKDGKSEKAAKAIAGAVASYKAKGGGKGPTAKQK